MKVSPPAAGQGLMRWMCWLLIGCAVAVGAVFVWAGLHLLFGPPGQRLARNADTILPALAWAIAMWVFITIVAWAFIATLLSVMGLGVRKLKRHAEQTAGHVR